MLTIAGAAARAAATSCGPNEPPWQEEYASPLRAQYYGPEHEWHGVLVPLDAQPWLSVPCQDYLALGPAACELHDEGGTVIAGVTVEQDGAEFCPRARAEEADYTHAYLIRRFVPTDPLTPGGAFTLRCDDTEIGELRVRDTDEPAAPVQDLDLQRAYFKRSDDGGCCGDGGDLIELTVGDTTPAYLDEGGYIEAVLPGGQHLAFIRAEDDKFVLPGLTEGVIEVTPVSASGERGETLKIDAGELDGDLVYTPCSVGGRRPDNLWWLLAPLAWISAHGRRRRRSP